MLKSLRRFVYEYRNLLSVLSPRDKVMILVQSLLLAPQILRSRRLTRLDRAMSRDMTVRFHRRTLHIPVHTIDVYLGSGTRNSFTFGTVREMIANDVYLRAFRPTLRCACVLDLGCNRGLFSLIAEAVLGAGRVIAVEPRKFYAFIHPMLTTRNATRGASVYWKMLGTREAEQRDAACVSMATILREHQLTSIDFAKIDIEGAEGELFREPDWLAITQNLAMELHPRVTPVEPILAAIVASGLALRTTDQFGRRCAWNDAMFAYASRTGELKD